MEWLLRLRAWQLFTLCLIIPVLTGLLIVAYFEYNSLVSTDPKYPELFDLETRNLAYPIIVGVTTLLWYMIVKLVWQYQVGTKLARKLHAYRYASLISFRISVLAPPLVLLLTAVYFLFWFSSVHSNAPDIFESTDLTPLVLAAIFLVSWVICISFRYFHMIALLNKVPNPRIHHRSRSEINLFLLLFWPIGIWVLQPNIKAFHEKVTNNKITDHMID